MLPLEGRVRVLVEGVRPEIDHGAYPAKGIVGELGVAKTDIFTDRHASLPYSLNLTVAPLGNVVFESEVHHAGYLSAGRP